MATRVKSTLVVLSAMSLLAVISCGRSRTSTDVKTGASPKWEQPTDVKLPPPAETYEVLGVMPGLAGFSVKYDDKVYRGGDPKSKEAAETLKKWNIRTIVTVTPTDMEREMARGNGWTLVEVPFEKASGPSAETLARFVDAVRQSDGAVYIHCHGGTHRGGVLGLAYRVHVLDWPYEKALVEFGRLGGSLMEDHAMLEAVRTWHK